MYLYHKIKGLTIAAVLFILLAAAGCAKLDGTGGWPGFNGINTISANGGENVLAAKKNTFWFINRAMVNNQEIPAAELKLERNPDAHADTGYGPILKLSGSWFYVQRVDDMHLRIHADANTGTAAREVTIELHCGDAAPEHITIKQTGVSAAAR